MAPAWHQNLRGALLAPCVAQDGAGPGAVVTARPHTPRVRQPRAHPRVVVGIRHGVATAGRVSPHDAPVGVRVTLGVRVGVGVLVGLRVGVPVRVGVMAGAGPVSA